MSRRISNVCAAAKLLNEIEGRRGGETLLAAIANCVDTLQGVVKTCGDDYEKLAESLGLVVEDGQTPDELGKEIEEEVRLLKIRLGRLEPLSTLFWTYDEEKNDF